MQPILDAAGHEPDDALVPAVAVHDGTEAHGLQRVEIGHRLLAHRRLDASPLPVDRVELQGQFVGLDVVVGEQALDPDRDVGEPAGRVDSRSDGETHVAATGAPRVAAGDAQQRAQPGARMSGTDPAQAGGNQQPVVAVEPDEVGDGAQRHEVEKRLQRRAGGSAVRCAAPQFGAQRDQQVEHDADAGQVGAAEVAARLVGVDDRVGVGQLRPGQVVVGDDDAQPAFARCTHAVDACDAAVDGDQPVGPAQARMFAGQRDDRLGQAVAVFEAVRDQVVDAGAEHPKPAHGDRAGGGAVAVVVGDDAQRLACCDRVGQQHGGTSDAFHRIGSQQAVEPLVELVGGCDAACGEQARQFGFDQAYLEACL